MCVLSCFVRFQHRTLWGDSADMLVTFWWPSAPELQGHLKSASLPCVSEPLSIPFPLPIGEVRPTRRRRRRRRRQEINVKPEACPWYVQGMCVCVHVQGLKKSQQNSPWKSHCLYGEHDFCLKPLHQHFPNPLLGAGALLERTKASRMGPGPEHAWTCAAHSPLRDMSHLGTHRMPRSSTKWEPQNLCHKLF